MSFGKYSRLTLLLIIHVLSISPAQAQGGNGAGGKGGGNVVVCFKHEETANEVIDLFLGAVQDKHLNDIDSIQAYDLYYANLPNNDSGKQVQAHIWDGYNNLTLSGFGSVFQYVFPALFQVVAQGEANFPARSVREVDYPVENLTRETRDPTSLRRKIQEALRKPEDDPTRSLCILTTAVVQERIEGPPAPGSTAPSVTHRALIDARLFHHKAHSELSQKVLLLHERIYSVAIDLGQKDSGNTTILIGYMLNQAVPIRIDQFKKEFIALGFKGMNFNYGIVGFDELDLLASMWADSAGYASDHLWVFDTEVTDGRIQIGKELQSQVAALPKPKSRDKTGIARLQKIQQGAQNWQYHCVSPQDWTYKACDSLLLDLYNDHAYQAGRDGALFNRYEKLETLRAAHQSAAIDDAAKFFASQYVDSIHNVSDPALQKPGALEEAFRKTLVDSVKNQLMYSQRGDDVYNLMHQLNTDASQALHSRFFYAMTLLPVLPRQP